MAQIIETQKDGDTIYRIQKYSNGNLMSKTEVIECEDGRYETKDGKRYNNVVDGKVVLYDYDGKPIFYKNNVAKDPMMKKLCEMFDAEVYGDNIDDIEYDEDKVSIARADMGKQGILTYLCSDPSYFRYQFPANQFKQDWDWVGTKDFEMFLDYFGFYEKGVFYCDPFIEYSLFLQGKENKWEECKKILKF